MALLFSFLMAMFVTMLLIPPLMRNAERWQVVDMPGERKVHGQAIPRIGGVAMVVGALIPILVWLPMAREVSAFLIGAVIILGFGVWDDRANLDYRVKFLGQALAVAVVIGYGEIMAKTLPLFADGSAPWLLAAPLTVFFLLGVTNAINLTDGLDGLAGGTAMLSIGAVAVLGFMSENVAVILISLAVIGSILGFLRFNTHPARVFMGDGGSQFLGYTAGVLAIMLTQNPNAALSPALPLLLLAWPLLDTATVMFQRVRARRSPFSPDKNHLHHRLLDLGFAHSEAVFIAYVVQSGFVLLAYYLRFESDLTVVGAFVAVCAMVVAAIYVPLGRGWRRPQALGEHHGRPHLFGIALPDLTHHLALLSARATALTLAVVVAAVCVLSAPVTDGVSLALFGLAAVLLAISVQRGGDELTWFERGALYLLGALVVFVLQVASNVLTDFETAFDVYFILLAIAIVVGFRWSRQRRFEMTPLDFLVIFAAFAVPALPGAFLNQLQYSEFIAKLIVLFYSIELVLHESGVKPIHVRACLSIAYLAFAVRGVL